VRAAADVQDLLAAFPGILAIMGTPGTYTLLDKIGSGVSGVVYRIRRRLDDVDLVAKVSTTRSSPGPGCPSPEGEAHCLELCDHPAVVSIIDKHQSSCGTLFLLIMELVSHGDLRQEIKYRASILPEPGYFSCHQIGLMFLQLLLAIRHIHAQGIIHRDIKTGNILLGPGGSVKLCDFGFAVDAGPSESPMPQNILCGTPYYLAPEIWRRQPYGQKADIWALGVVLYEMIALARPFPEENQIDLYRSVIEKNIPEIPMNYGRFLGDLVNYILQVDPDCRPDANRLLQTPHIRCMIKNIRVADKSLARIPEPVRVRLAAELDALLHEPGSEIKLLVEKRKEGFGNVRMHLYCGSLPREPEEPGPRDPTEPIWEERYVTVDRTGLTICTSTFPRGTITLPIQKLVMVHLARDTNDWASMFVVDIQGGAKLLFRPIFGRTADDWGSYIDSLIVAKAGGKA
jgi:serine/threonine protein kinase